MRILSSPGKLCSLLLVAVTLVGVVAQKAMAAPPKASIGIVTLDADSGDRVPYVTVMVRQVAGKFPEPSIITQTNVAGQVWVAVFPGTYEISSPSGVFTQTVTVSSRQEIVVPLWVTTGRQ